MARVGFTTAVMRCNGPPLTQLEIAALVDRRTAGDWDVAVEAA